jgi:hypothetical protein
VSHSYWHRGEEIRQFFRNSDPAKIRELVDLGHEIWNKLAPLRRKDARRQPKSPSVGNKSQEQASEAPIHNPNPDVALSPKAPKPQDSTLKQKSVSATLDGKTFVVDGLNVAFSYLRLEGRLSFDALLTLLLEIRMRNGAFICIFDATTPHRIREKVGKRREILYSKLTKSRPDDFVEVPGGTKADDFILREADKNGRLIISNDRFDDYRTEFEWVAREDKCLFKGTMIRGIIEVPGLGISIPLRRDSIRMVDELINHQ